MSSERKEALSRRKFLGVSGGALWAASGGAGVLGLAGCGDDGDDSADGNGVAGSQEEGGTVRLWSMHSEGEPNQVLFAEAIEDFTDEVGIDVQVEWKGREPLDALLPALNTENVPADLITDNGTALINKLASTENAVDLSDVYSGEVPGEDKTVDEVLGEAIKEISSTADGTPVLVPFSISTFLFFYNGQSFPDLQDSPPQDWDEFFAILDEQMGQGRQPLAMDGSAPPLHALYTQYLMSSIVGREGWVAAHTDETGQTWREPEYLDAARIMEKLVSGGYFLDGYDASQFPAMQQKWSNNESDFIFNGTWLSKEVEPYADPDFEFRSFPFPAVPGYELPPAFVLLQGMSVVTKADDVELAKRFVAWMLKSKYQEKTTTEVGIIPVRFAEVGVPADVEGGGELLSSGNLVTNTPPNQAYMQDVFYVVHADLAFGKLNAEEFIDELATASEEFWKNQG